MTSHVDRGEVTVMSLQDFSASTFLKLLNHVRAESRKRNQNGAGILRIIN